MALTGYKIANGNDPDELERAVLSMAAEGYVPYGSALYDAFARLWTQTMVIGDVAGGGGGGGGGVDKLVDLTDINLGISEPLAAGHFIMCYGGNVEDGYLFSNFQLSSTVQGLIDAFTPGVIDIERAVMSNITAASDEADALVKFNNLLGLLKSGGYMAPDA